jgi:hypothetical protein
MSKQEVEVPEDREPRKGQVYRHKQRGSCYTVVGRASLQANRPVDDEEVLVIYRGKDGKLWARLVEEFRDGRFELLSSRIESS